MSKTYVIGVDGGGTKTLGLLIDETGAELARTSLASSNIHANPHPVVEGVLQTLVTSLCKEAGIAVSQLSAISLGMSGCDSPKDQAVLEGFLKPILSPSTKMTIVNDAIVAARAVLPRMHGMLLIAGTGSICFGWNEKNGTNARCGGWGHLLADEGSGYLIGLRGLQAILQGVDGRGPVTTLLPVMFEVLGFDVNEPRSVIQYVYGEKGTKANIANLARYVFQEAAKGDEASLKIVNEQAYELARTIPPVYNKLFPNSPTPVDLGLWGGNLVHVEIYRNEFLKQLHKHGMNLNILIDANADAVHGAANNALASLA